MSNQYRAQMVNSAHMANNSLGINVDDRFSILSSVVRSVRGVIALLFYILLDQYFSPIPFRF